MRLSGDHILKDHALLTGQTSDDHHPSAESYRVLVNSQAIAAFSTYNLDISLSKAGHSVVWGVLRGNVSTDILGHEGVWFQARDAAATATSFGIRSYSTGYPTSYMGAYSTLHGDSYLSFTDTFGTGIRLDDTYITGSTWRMVFRNVDAVTRYLTVYGLGTVK